MSIEGASDEPLWYVVHTLTNYEDKVKASLERVIENRGMQDYFFGIIIPVLEEVNVKDGKERVVQKKVFPGYVLVKMILTDETWLLVRNIRGVTSFVGPGSKPSPLSDREAQALGIEISETFVDYEVGDQVKIISGPLANFNGTVEAIMLEKERVKVLVPMFGRTISAELEYSQIQKIF